VVSKKLSQRLVFK